MYFRTYIDKNFSEVLREAEKEFTKCFYSDLSSHSEEELRKALEKKMEERQKKQTLKEKTKNKLLELLKEIKDIDIDDETTKNTCSFSFKTEQGKVRGIISLDKDTFF